MAAGKNCEEDAEIHLGRASLHGTPGRGFWRPNRGPAGRAKPDPDGERRRWGEDWIRGAQREDSERVKRGGEDEDEDEDGGGREP